MQQFQSKRENLHKIIGSLCPKIQKKLEKAKLEAMNCHCIWGGDHRFEVEHHNNRFVVDLEESICGCRIWDLTGISCCHAAVAIMYVRKKVEHFVSIWYTKAT